MTNTEQKAIALRLQKLLLTRWEKLLEAGELSPTDARTLSQFLRDNGWSLNLDELPGGLRSKLTEDIDPEEIPNFSM